MVRPQGRQTRAVGSVREASAGVRERVGWGGWGGSFTVVDTEQQTLASSGEAGKTGSGAVTFCEEAGKERMEKG